MSYNQDERLIREVDANKTVNKYLMILMATIIMIPITIYAISKIL